LRPQPALASLVPASIVLALIVLLCLMLAPVGALAQEIGNQGTDPFTGQPANPVPPVTLPDTTPKIGGTREDRLVFKSQTVLVQVPTVVTDKSGNHVHNLTKDDFKILEDGKQQKISSFEEVTAGTRPVPAKTFPGTFSNLALDGQQPLAITVIALDVINTPFLDQAYARKQLIKYLADNLDSGHVLGLVVMGSKGIKVLGGLNSDPAALIAALKKASGEVSSMETFSTDGKALASADADPSELTGGSGPGEDALMRMRRFILNADALEGQYQQSRAIEDTMRAFLAIAWSLSGIPGRKSLIWATGSFPFPLDSPSTLPGGNLSQLYERAMDALKNAQIAVYPVDVRGLVSTTPTDDAKYDGAVSSAGLSDAGSGRSWLQASTVNSMVTFAEMTGGRAFYNSNDLTAGFKRAADDSSSYYLLGYYVDTHNTRPGWRKLQVQLPLKDKGWEVRARTGLFFTNTGIDPQLTHQADIDFALSSPFDSTGIQVTMQWQPPGPEGDKKAGDKKKVGFALRLPATSVIEESDKNRFDVDFIAQATKLGVPAGKAGQTIKGIVPASALDKIKAEGIFYSSALELAPGDYEVRFVVRDNLTGRIGSVSAPLTVNQ
jgi:VWFA-related protein